MESCTGATQEREEGMEHKFGLFNTVEELNRAAAAQKEEGERRPCMPWLRRTALPGRMWMIIWTA